jgi:hypothetical protein
LIASFPLTNGSCWTRRIFIDEKEANLSAGLSKTDLHKSTGSARHWLLLVLLAFGVGALLITFVLYIPTWQKHLQSQPLAASLVMNVKYTKYAICL